jgi:hypothetical protein
MVDVFIRYPHFWEEIHLNLIIFLIKMGSSVSNPS